MNNLAEQSPLYDGSQPLSMRVQIVTPKIAAEYLKRQTSNRKLHKSLVQRFADDMKRYAWDQNGESIKFTQDGVLVDGQHRLSAVIRANIPIPFLIAEGLKPQCFETIDSGKSRNAADVLNIAGYSNSTNVAAIVRLIKYYDAETQRSIQMTGATAAKLTSREILEFAEHHPEMDRVTREAKKWCASGASTFASPAIMGAAYYIFALIDQDVAYAFLDALTTGANLPQGAPVLRLRTRLLGEAQSAMRRGKRPSSHYTLALIIKTWNAARKGESISVIKWNHLKSPFPRAR